VFPKRFKKANRQRRRTKIRENHQWTSKTNDAYKFSEKNLDSLLQRGHLRDNTDLFMRSSQAYTSTRQNKSSFPHKTNKNGQTGRKEKPNSPKVNPRHPNQNPFDVCQKNKLTRGNRYSTCNRCHLPLRVQRLPIKQKR